MTLDAGFLQMTTQELTVTPLSTHSAYGAPTYSTGDSSSYPVMVEAGNRVVVDSQGVEQVATATLFVLTSSGSVGIQDQITLPDGRQPDMLSVDVNRDEEGQHHLEVAIR